MGTIYGLCTDMCLRHSDRILFTKEGLTYSDFQQIVNSKIGYLQDQGYSSHDVVAILSVNSVDWLAMFFAAAAMNIKALLLDTNLHKEVYLQQMRNVAVKTVFVSDKFDDDYSEIKSVNLKDVVAENFADKDLPVVSSEDIVALFYTSGTTGQPKVIGLTNDNIYYTAIESVKVVKINADDVFLAILPYFHVYGLIASLLAPFAAGAQIVILNSLKGKDILGHLGQYPITIFPAVPQMWEIFFDRIVKKIKSQSELKYKFFMFMINHAPTFRHLGFGFLVKKIFHPVHKAFGLNLRYLLSGGYYWKKKYCIYYRHMGFTIIEGYGLTETVGPIGGPDDSDHPKPLSVGKPYPENQMVIRNSGKDDIGEIWLKGRSIFPGYYNNPQATAEVFDKDGWFNSGDLGFIDKDGDLHIRGRAKNVIVLGSGKNAYPEDISAFYQQSELINELAVFGRKINDKVTVFAVITPEQKTRDSYERIKQEIKKMSRELPSYQKIGSFAVSYDSLPRTSTRKIKVHEVIENLEKGLYQTSSDDPNFVVKEIVAESREMSRVIAVLKKSLATDVFYVNESLSDFSIDSLDYIDLIADLEKELKIKIDPQQFIDSETMESLVNYLTECEKDSSGQSILDRLRTGDIARKARNIYNPIWDFGIMVIRNISKLKIVYQNREKSRRIKLQDGNIIVANHRSIFDALWLLGSISHKERNNVYIVTRKKHRILKSLMHSRMIYIEQKGNFISGLKQSADVLRQGKSLIIFPEGERSKNGDPGEFKKGGAFLAKTLNKKVQPVSIRSLTNKNIGDYGPGRHLLVHEPIDPQDYHDIDALNQKIKDVIISGLKT